MPLKCKILYPVVTLIIFAVTLFINYGASTGLYSEKDVGEVSDMYFLEITPASWTFTIWAFIYSWQAIWIIYTLYLICKYTMNTIIFGNTFWITYNFANLCNIAWILLWVNEFIWPSALLLCCIAISLIIAGYVAHKFMFLDSNKVLTANAAENYGGIGNEDEQLTPNDKNMKQKAHEWIDEAQSIRPALYGTVLNGVPFYATWTVIASNLNVGISICYDHGLDITTSSILMLSILSAIIVVYWYLDFFLLRNYLRFTYSPYIVLIVAFCGVLTNEYTTKPTFIFTAILLGLSCVTFVIKIVMGIMMRNKPVQAFHAV